MLCHTILTMPYLKKRQLNTAAAISLSANEIFLVLIEPQRMLLLNNDTC